jgi:uncharacterized protein (DUF1810 family)
MTNPDLIRFVDAQAPIFPSVVKELTEGRKTSHWMWFIFPQLVGLGRSSTAQHYAIRDLDQAKRYLSDPLLGKRLIDCVGIMMSHEEKSALEILGPPDDYKFRSCLTLFRKAARDSDETAFFSSALDQFYEGRPDQRTLGLMSPG